MSRRTNWRGHKEWVSLGLPFSTTSDQALKLYDAALTQLAGYYNDASLGGLSETLEKLIQTDPANVMAHVLMLGVEVLGSARCPVYGDDFRKKLNLMVELAEGANVSSWEKLHTKAIVLLANGHMTQACHIWEEILVEFPLDYLALKLAFDAYLYMGSMPERRDMLARAMRQWTPDIPLYGYILGMYAFSLGETNIFSKAETLAKKGVEINPYDTWSVHALTHTYEMQGKITDSLNHLNSTVKEWSTCDMLACHHYWHLAVDNIEQGNYDQALEVFDGEIVRRALIGRSSFNVSDCSSLLYRLQLEGVSVGERWDDVYEICRPSLEGNHMTFTDPHFIMTCLGAKKPQSARAMMTAIEEFIEKSSQTHGQCVKKEVGAAICQSLIAYDEGHYAKAVELMLPVRYQIYRIGGSNTQRDVLNLFLIDAALKSPVTEHNKLGRTLLFERKELIEESALTDRLMTKALIHH